MDASAHLPSRVRLRTWRRLACCAALCACDWAAAGDMPAYCEFEIPPGHPLTNRSGTIASMESMPQSCLKWLLIECSEGASRQLMDLGSAAMCSMGYEALLKTGFGGSFQALMEWWRRERAQAPGSSPEPY